MVDAEIYPEVIAGRCNLTPFLHGPLVVRGRGRKESLAADPRPELRWAKRFSARASPRANVDASQTRRATRDATYFVCNYDAES